LAKKFKLTPEQYARVKLCGREVRVHPLSGFTVLKLAQLEEGDQVAHLQAAYDAARSAVPELTDAEVQGLKAEQIGAIIGIARQQIEQVEQGLAGNP
jgi:hypothetical protein